jgi:DNA-binding NarL/FixJ family response regulator
MTEPIRVIIADDHPIYRDGFKLLLKNQGDATLVGEAEDGSSLIKLAKDIKPDVIITDIVMPGIDGVATTKEISKVLPEAGIIAISMFNDDNLIVDMLEAGARGYLLKNTNKEKLIEAIKAVYCGDTYYCAATSTKLTRLIAQSKFDPQRHLPKPKFTPRELDVIVLLCQEYSNKEIATKLDISIRTVESYKENILHNLGAKNMVGIAVYAVRNGIC